MAANKKNGVVFMSAHLVPNSCLAETLINTDEAQRTKSVEKGRIA
jgi:hypothetical protein